MFAAGSKRVNIAAAVLFLSWLFGTSLASLYLKFQSKYIFQCLCGPVVAIVMVVLAVAGHNASADGQGRGSVRHRRLPHSSIYSCSRGGHTGSSESPTPCLRRVTWGGGPSRASDDGPPAAPCASVCSSLQARKDGFQVGIVQHVFLILLSSSPCRTLPPLCPTHPTPGLARIKSSF